MNIVNLVLSKILVKRFYSENAGFFLVLLGVCFGFLKAPQHFEMSMAVADRPIFYSIPITLWLLYALKVLRFCSRVNREKESMMLGWVGLAGKSSVLWSAFRLQLSLLFPVVGYGLFMAYVAFGEEIFTSSAIVLVFLMLLLAGMTFWQFKDLLRLREFGLVSGESFLSWRPKHYFEFYLHYLLRFEGLRLIFMKLLSLFILYISIQVFLEEAIDLRYLSLGVLLSATANGFFSMDYARFERSDLQLFRNLPVGFLERSASFWLTFLVLAIPEFLILMGQLSFILNWFGLLSLILFIPSLLMVFKALAYQSNINQERFTKQVFFLSAILFFVILSHVEVWTLGVLGLSASLVLLRIWLRKSEVS